MFKYSNILKNLPLQTVGANFFLILLLFSSCKKNDILNLDTQSPNDRLNVTLLDTSTLVTKTERTYYLRTDRNSISNANPSVLIGVYNDPVFGRTSASLYTQMRLGQGVASLGVNPQVDSVVLALVYYPSYYGKRECVKQNINVYSISEDILPAKSYYSTDTMVTDGIDLANAFSSNPNPTQNVTINGNVLSPQLRVPLNNSFGQDILNLLNLIGQDNNSFQSNKKGLFITTENTSGLNNGEGNIFKFKPEDPQSGLIIYYHDNVQSGKIYTISLDSVARFSNFKHDYNSIDPNLALQLGQSSQTQNDVVFIQPLGGTKVKIQIPYLLNMIDSGKIAINKAELLIKPNIAAAYQVDTFIIPPKLYLYGISEDGGTYEVEDTKEGENYFDGGYNETEKQYRFNLARYIQQVLNGETQNNGLYLVSYNEVLSPNRLVLGGGSSSAGSYKMKLNIVRTKLP